MISELRKIAPVCFYIVFCIVCSNIGINKDNNLLVMSLVSVQFLLNSVMSSVSVQFLLNLVMSSVSVQFLLNPLMSSVSVQFLNFHFRSLKKCSQ